MTPHKRLQVEEIGKNDDFSNNGGKKSFKFNYKKTRKINWCICTIRAHGKRLLKVDVLGEDENAILANAVLQKIDADVLKII